MNSGPKTAPDHRQRSAKTQRRTAKSRVTEVEDPVIAGDAAKGGKRRETNEANVDEAGQIRRRDNDVDLLH
jgi:hypothetical protein